MQAWDWMQGISANPNVMLQKSQKREPFEIRSHTTPTSNPYGAPQLATFPKSDPRNICILITRTYLHSQMTGSTALGGV